MLKTRKFLFGLIAMVFLLLNQDAKAQSRSYSNMYIPGNGFISIFQKHSFSKGGNGVVPGMISTARKGAKGYVNFAKGSSWEGASDAQFIDGYVRVYHDEAFVFPIGANKKYRPIAISGGAMTSAAYFDKNPSSLQTTANKAAKANRSELVIRKISDKEYWELDGNADTKVTFTWGLDSNIDKLTDENLEDLSIVGLRNGRWEIIPSHIDDFAVDNASHKFLTSNTLSSFSTGTITSDNNVTLSDYDYFTLAAINTESISNKMDFSMYPNPRLTRMPLNVKYRLATESGTLRIFSVSGKLLAERTLSGENGLVTLSNVTNVPGAYSVSITDSEGQTVAKKLIVVAE